MGKEGMSVRTTAHQAMTRDNVELLTPKILIMFVNHLMWYSQQVIKNKIKIK